MVLQVFTVGSLYLVHVGFFGFIMNSTVFWLYWKNKKVRNKILVVISMYISLLIIIFKLWTEYHLLLTNLILTEWLICIYGIPVDFKVTTIPMEYRNSKT